MGTTAALLPSVEVCERLNIDRSTLSRWVQIGRITPAMRLPGKTGSMLFSPEDVDALLAPRTAGDAA